MKMKLAEALLRRKFLADKVKQVENVKLATVYEVKTTRKAAHEGVDDVILQVPKLTLGQVTAEYDFYSKQLRLVDAAIQQANWTTELEFSENVNQSYDEATKKQ